MNTVQVSEMESRISSQMDMEITSLKRSCILYGYYMQHGISTYRSGVKGLPTMSYSANKNAYICALTRIYKHREWNMTHVGNMPSSMNVHSDYLGRDNDMSWWPSVDPFVSTNPNSFQLGAIAFCSMIENNNREVYPTGSFTSSGIPYVCDTDQNLSSLRDSRMRIPRFRRNRAIQVMCIKMYRIICGRYMYFMYPNGIPQSVAQNDTDSGPLTIQDLEVNEPNPYDSDDDITDESSGDEAVEQEAVEQEAVEQEAVENETDEDGCCPICYESKEKIKLPCGHDICIACFNKLQDTTTKCHMCRHQFAETVYKAPREVMSNRRFMYEVVNLTSAPIASVPDPSALPNTITSETYEYVRAKLQRYSYEAYTTKLLQNITPLNHQITINKIQAAAIILSQSVKQTIDNA
tara:strand:- start:3400 stop:4620 length:1221 start_codon:yes stop_codon:yes gene_type:complete